MLEGIILTSSDGGGFAGANFFQGLNARALSKEELLQKTQDNYSSESENGVIQNLFEQFYQKGGGRDTTSICEESGRTSNRI